MTGGYGLWLLPAPQLASKKKCRWSLTMVGGNMDNLGLRKLPKEYDQRWRLLWRCCPIVILWQDGGAKSERRVKSLLPSPINLIGEVWDRFFVIASKKCSPDCIVVFTPTTWIIPPKFTPKIWVDYNVPVGGTIPWDRCRWEWHVQMRVRYRLSSNSKSRSIK